MSGMSLELLSSISERPLRVSHGTSILNLDLWLISMFQFFLAVTSRPPDTEVASTFSADLYQLLIIECSF